MIHHLLRNDCCGIPKSLNMAIWVVTLVLFLFIGPVVFMWWVRDQMMDFMAFLGRKYPGRLSKQGVD